MGVSRQHLVDYRCFVDGVDDNLAKLQVVGRGLSGVEHDVTVLNALREVLRKVIYTHGRLCVVMNNFELLSDSR